MARLLTLVALLVTSGCVPRGWNLRAFPECADKLPPKVLVDAGCPPDGVCGYSCLPDRWKEID